MFKKFLLSLFAVSTSYAGTMGCARDSVTVPCAEQGWEIGGGALYAKPFSNSLLNPYIISGFISADSQHYSNLSSPWDWGFTLTAGYYFNTGNDINVNWLRFMENYRASKTAFFPGTSDGIPASTNTEAFRLKPRIDVVNIEMAQSAALGSQTGIRLHGGLQYANGQITRQVAASQQLDNEPAYLYQITSLNAKYDGVGPRIGGKLTRALPYNLSVFAEGATSLLIGKARTKLSGEFRSSRIYSINNFSDATRIVPGLDMKVGASYKLNMNTGQLNLTAGWMLLHYFNMYTELPGDVFNLQTTPTSHEFSLNGPFIQGKWVSKA
ncbi:Lpg1974 family pore-forming outer membrane protein [Legionella saoudiensis]|uniref:Lpg1974 family pore-forming outer membrane protein n=1 Tax=Legionella saoudiensis TaxID=1750561 RepID=UPI00072FE714|nr:Lpg1974 family pore-forming outer membrane protein [Legionella saoudiensis]